MSTSRHGDNAHETDGEPDSEPLRWGFCWLAGTLSEQICHHCEIQGVTLLVEDTGTHARSVTNITLLCADHKAQYQRLWRAYLPQGEMSAEEAERLSQ